MITPANEVMFLTLCVCLSVCQHLRKLMNFDEFLRGLDHDADRKF